MKRMQGVIPEVDPIEHMKINDADFIRDVDGLVKLEERCRSHKLKTRPDFQEIYASYEHKVWLILYVFTCLPHFNYFILQLALEEEYKEAKAAFKKAKSLLQGEELGCRKRVLRRLQYCDENDQITVKVSQLLCFVFHL